MSTHHTCDIFADANREIWALKSYFVFRNRDKFSGPCFSRSLKVAKSSDNCYRA